MLTTYKRFAIMLFDWVPKKYPEILKPVKLVLPKSGIVISPSNYISVICLTAFIGHIIGLITLLILLFFILDFNMILAILSIIFLPFVIGSVILVIGIFYPHQKVSLRRANIDTNLPFAIAHMGAIAASGISPLAIFKLIARFKEYDVFAEEMEKIVRNIEVFGLDPLSAMREVAKRTPSQKLKQLLFGLVSTIDGGGDLKTYLKNAGEQSLFSWRMKRQKYLQQLSTYAEFYTGLLIAAPLFIISLFSVMYLIQPQLGGFDIFQLMRLSVYILVPILNLTFLAFLKITQIEM